MRLSACLTAALLIAGVTSAPPSRGNSHEDHSSQQSHESSECDRDKAPNVVMIILDDLGWNDVGYHNSPDIRTPTIDKLASEGVILENYYVQPICTPSRATLMSGMYDIHTGLNHDVIHSVQQNGLPIAIPTLADKLREQGYATHMVGKWHLGHYMYDYMPLHRGFDSFLGIVQALGNHTAYSACEWFPLPPNPAAPHWYFCGKDLRWGDAPYDVSTSGIFSTDLFTQRAVDIINQHATLEPGRPFFIDLSYSAPHSPLQAPASYIAQYSHIPDTNRRLYAAMVTQVDDGIKRVVDALAATGLDKNTIVIVSTDNGGENHWGGNSYPFRGNKQTMWEGAFRGVGLVNSPLLHLNGQGRVSREFVHISDWYPTLVNLACGDVTGLNLDGNDIWKVIRNDQRSPRTELLHSIDPLMPKRGARREGSPFDNRVMAALRVGKWKIITGNPSQNPVNNNWFVSPTQVPNAPLQSQQGGFDFITSVSQSQPGYVVRVATDTVDPNKNIWLFDIEADPYETTDLSNSEPAVVDTMLARLAYYNSTAVPTRFPPNDPAGDPALFGGYFAPWVPTSTGVKV